MLQTIRDRSQGLIVAVIVGLISLTFVLWGVESYISEGRQVVVAEVDGDEILLAEFQDALQRARRQAEAILGDAFDADDWSSETAKQRTLDALIDNRLLDRLAADARVRVSDAQVARQLQQIPAFQQDGVFARALYEQRVSMLGYGPVGFEQQLRADMQRAQLRGGIAVSEFVTREEAELVTRLREQKRDIGYAVIPGSEFADEVELTDAGIEAHYQANQESYRTPERVVLEYLELSPAALAAEVVVDEAALRRFYDANHALYTVTEQRNVNHILIQVAQDADEAAVSSAREKAAAALARAAAGEDFEVLARELSDDSGSKTEGGETGLFPRGVMAPEFEQAAFALAAVGDVTEPVRTQFGFHLIKLKAIEPGGLKPFDEVKGEVETAYRAQEAQKLFLDQAEQFSNLVYEHPDSLDAAREALALTVQRSEALTREEIAERYSEKLANAVFETEVLVDGLNSEPVELPDGRVIAARVLEHRPSAIPPLAEVRATVADELTELELRKLTAAAGQDLLEKLRGGATVTELVKERGFGWESAESAGRESDEVNRAVLRAAFAVAVPGSEPVYTGLAIGTADYAVVRVANVVTPPASEIAAADVQRLRNEMSTARGSLAWEEFLAALRADSDIRIYRENL